MSGPLRVMVVSATSPGHAFPGLALARELRARGHDVLLETSEQWREAAEGLGLRFVAMEDLGDVPREPGWSGWALQGARSLLPVMWDYRPDVVVSDVVMPGAPLAAEVLGVRWATLISLLYPLYPRGLPVYPSGFVPPRTRLGASLWPAIAPLLGAMVQQARWRRRMPRLLNAVRSELGLPRRQRFPGGVTSYGTISDRLAIVATFPQLEYPRRWPAHVHVTGPMFFELPHPEVELPRGEEPLVLVAASTVQEPERLVRVTLEALSEQPVRVVATMSRRGEAWSGPTPDNAAVVDWVSYAQVMPRASLVVCSGGHGTVVRALSEGVPVLVSPGGGDQAENGARLTWAGAGLMLPSRLLRPGSLRWAVRSLLSDPRFAARARAIAAWGRENDGAASGAELVERLARG